MTCWLSLTLTELPQALDLAGKHRVVTDSARVRNCPEEVAPMPLFVGCEIVGEFGGFLQLLVEAGAQ